MGIVKSASKTGSSREENSTEDPRSGSMADALFTATQQRILGLLFGQPNRSFFVTELIEMAAVGRGAVQRELARLAGSGLVSTEKQGNQKHYRANADSPLFDELCSIVQKTIGLEDPIRAALEPLTDDIALALIYGSVAKRSDTADSDIDLLIVADDLTLEDLYTSTAEAEEKLGRTINPTLYTGREFRDRRKSGMSFLKRVLAGPIILLQGTLDGD